MFNLACKVKQNFEAIKNIITGIRFFRHYEVVVGAKGGRNASLLYMHEAGVPSRNIPARPVIKPALAEADTAWQMRMLMIDAALAVFLEGDKDAALASFEKAGMVGRDACKAYITSGKLAPNAPSTIRRKGSSNPLIDTGAMYNSITYEVRRK